jgi:predicted Holliday junction resolvase-like endonuclease
MLELIGTAILTGILVFAGCYSFYISKTKEMELEKASEIDKAVQKALQQSRNVVRGQIAEELLPLFPDFPYVLSDCKFIGKPIDYIVFDGMSEKRDSNEGDVTVIFADVKVNKARRTKVQNEIRKAIIDGRFRFETWYVKDGQVTVESTKPL